MPDFLYEIKDGLKSNEDMAFIIGHVEGIGSCGFEPS